MKHKTLNTLAENVKSKVVPVLQARLADAIDLHLNVKQAHWNVKGPDFIALHKLFDDVAEHVEEYVDTLAERIVQLGETADGTSRTVAKSTMLPQYPLEVDKGLEHCRLVAQHLAAFGEASRKAIDVSAEAGDADTADIFTEVSRGIDKDLWFVEAHVQADE